MKNSRGVIPLLPLLVAALFIIFGVGYYAYSKGQVRLPSTAEAPLSTSTEKCATYNDRGEEITACAVCGNGICEPYEACSSSYITEGGIVSMDCGVLYCEKDCKGKPQLDPNIPQDLP